ncbi:MAG TPA: dihydrofolate reductase family protein [Nitrospiraceae bacterium]|nr:dihydrofolate reductase family protein [Nitrospiraceae bacterium]
MRRLIMWNMVTLDGFFEGPKKWDIDWHNYVWGDELEQFSIEQSKSVGMLLFGRVTYEGMAGYWTTATGEVADFMNSIPKVVFSRTLDKAEWNNTRLVREHAVEEIAKLKQQPGKDLFVFGSADLSSTFTKHGLFDEYRLGLTPVVLGAGTPLFKPGPELRMNLAETRLLKSGCVILRYETVPATGGPTR